MQLVHDDDVDVNAGVVRKEIQPEMERPLM